MSNVKWWSTMLFAYFCAQPQDSCTQQVNPTMLQMHRFTERMTRMRLLQHVITDG